jgi:quinol monooxygenase YgiN
MHIQIVNFNLKDLTVDEYEELCNTVAGAFAQVPGLLSKVWLADHASNTFGGIYTWRDEQALRAYETSELFAAVVQNPHFANITVHEFGVLDRPTRVTNGAPAVAAAAR